MPTVRSLTSLRRLAVVLGTNEIASAVGAFLHRDGWGVVLTHDPYPPVLRRRMAFHDVLFGEPAVVDGVTAARADSTTRMSRILSDGDRVAVTPLSPLDISRSNRVDLLVDARMQKRRVKADLRSLADLTIGLGPGFFINCNCDIAVETRPPKNGDIVRHGRTDAADGVASRLGDCGSERFVYSASSGWWRTTAAIGTAVAKGAVLGLLDGAPMTAPLDGVLRGLVRDGTEVVPGVKLIEVDPRGAGAQWTGIDARGRTIAQATLNAIRVHVARMPPAAEAAAFHPI